MFLCTIIGRPLIFQDISKEIVSSKCIEIFCNFHVLRLIYILPKYWINTLITDQFRYPLEEFVRENEAEDKRCLALVEETLERCKKEGNPCVGLIVEPIQSEGGDFHGSNAWFQVN